LTNSLHDKLARLKSHAMYAICCAFTMLILSVLVLVVGYLVARGWSSLSISFFTQDPTGEPAHPGGMRHAIVGTGVLILLASLIGIPLGILAGVYLSEYESQSYLAAPVRFVSDVLAGVPSIVVGILGYELVVYPMGGFSAWAGALALAFIMVPIVCRTTEEMLRLVPTSYREAAAALGAGKARTILSVVLPSATRSVITGVMLAIARIAGETAPLLFTAAGTRLLPRRVEDLSRPFPSLTKQIFDYATGPYPAQKNLAMSGILVLIALVFCMNLAIRLATRRSRPVS
jgi:phosphate transport system permease protein